MTKSFYDGQHVVYVDPMKLIHSGYVVGQSDDGLWQYVQSDNPAAPVADWHFQVASTLIDSVIKP